MNPLAQREANAKRAITMLHKWWARRVGCVFRTMILSSLIPAEEWQRLDEEVRRSGIDAWTALYYRQHPKANPLIEKYLKDKVVLDPFMGGGTTIVEALRLGCKVIGVDVNPVAWFIVKKSVEPVDLAALDAAFERLKKEVAPDILRYYRTPCPHGDHEADVMYAFWVKKVQCTNCGRNTRLFSSFRLATKDGEDTVVCPYCYWVGQVGANRQSVVCPDCGREFHPKQGWAGGGRFTCEHCGHVDETVAWVCRTGRAPDYEMIALEYWCPQHGRGYKGVEEFDRELYRQACQEFEREKTNLPLPDFETESPPGYNTQQAIGQGLRHFTDLLNPRQLLGLGRLMQAIREIEDRAVRELMVVTLSDATNANNMLCKYNVAAAKLEPLFGHPVYWPPDQPVENNVWGTKYGRGPFSSYFDKTLRAVEWAQHPKEILTGGWVPMDDGAVTSLAGQPTAVISGASRAWLTARSSEDLSFLASKSVDAVITDLPYYGNVHYGEIADFFYVWLRAALKDEYPEFVAPVFPKEPEIEVNQAQDKDDADYRRSLRQVFQESHRVLKDEGPLVFTFHHEKPQAWGAVLEAVLEAGFNIKAVWTYFSEPQVGVGFSGGGIRFDTIIVCRTRGLDFGELEEMRYIERGKRASEYQVLLPQKRLDWLEHQLERGYDLSPLDRAHYLYALYKANRPLWAEIPRLYTRGLEEVTGALYRITRDRAYELISADIERLKEQGVLAL